MKFLKLSETSADRQDEKDKKGFTGREERTKDRVIAEATDRQDTRHLSCPKGLY